MVCENDQFLFIYEGDHDSFDYYLIKKGDR